MSLNKHLSAFTILEALISLILISIIIGLIYSLIDIIGKQMSVFGIENNQILEYNLFNTTMKRDIENAVNYEVLNNEIRLDYYDTKRVSYTRKEDIIIREVFNDPDTFKLNIISYKIYAGPAQKEDKMVEIEMNILNDTIRTNYFLTKNISEIINSKYLNEN